MNKRIRKITLTLLCAVMLLCLAGLGIFFGIKGKNRGNELNLPANSAESGAYASATATAGGTVSSGLNTNYKYEVRLNATTDADLVLQWQEALSYSSSSDNVYVVLERDWTAAATTAGFGSGVGFTAGGLDVPAGKKITLDLNGHKLDRNLKNVSGADSSVIEVEGNLTICDSSGNNSGKITGGRVLRDGGGIYVDGTGELTLNSGTICDNQAETRTINSTSTESTTVTGGISSDHGGAGVMVYGGKFTMNGGAISDNEAVVAIISGKNNNPHGGGVAVNAGGTFIMTDGLITRNKASFGGGIGVMTSGSTVAISGGTISYNTSIMDGGGGIYFWEKGGGTVENCLITENTAEDGTGGGIVVNIDVAITIRNCKITNNHIRANTQTVSATNINLSGGGIYVCSYAATGNVTIENCTVSGNTSINQAGGILIRGGMSAGTLKITGCKITDNTAANHGGGIFYGDSTGDNSSTNTVIPTLENSIITKNTAGGNGGGIYMATYQKLGIKGGVMVVDNGSTNVYLNSTNGTASTAATRVPKLVIQGLLYGGGVVTHIGVTYAKASVIATNANTQPVFTSGYYTASNTQDTEYFFCDNSTNVCSWNTSKEKTLIKNTTSYNNSTPFDWEYELDGNGTWLPVTSPYFTRVYDGSTITGVRASYSGTLINSTAANDFLFVTCSDGSTSFSGLTDVGSVGFVINGNSSGSVPSSDVPFYCITIEVVPQDVTVEIADKTSVYGDPIETLTTDAAANLGVNTPVKDYGFGVGKYAIRSNGWTNKNYNVTFENATGTAEYGVYEITQRDVTVILNEAQFEYGANAIAVAQGKKDTPDADGKYLEGGWRYDSGSKEFISADISATKNPFKLSSTAEYTATQSAVSGFTFPTVGTSTPITTSDLNPNYNITFKRDGAPTVPTGLLTIKNAKITVDPDTTHGYATVYGVEDAATKTLAIPSANIKLKGGQSVSSIMYSYVFDSNDTNAVAPATTPVLNTTSGDWEWQDGQYNSAALTGTAVSWSPNNATALTKTSAGTYKTYFKLSAPNHEDLVQEWTLVINSKTVTVTVRAEKNDKVPPSTADNWVALTGNATYGDELRVAIDLDAITDTSVDKTKLTNYKVYYKGTTAGSAAYPDVTGLTFDTTTLLTTDGSVHQTFGTTAAPTAAGSYTATFVPKNGDYNLGGNQTVSITVDKKKVTTPPSDGSTGGTKTYTASEQTFTVSGYDFNVMQLGTLPTGITDKNSTFASASSTSYTLQATNAGEYKVPFSLKDTNNYEWDSSVTVNASKQYELTLTIKQAPLKVTFKSPAENKTPPEAAKWLWKPDEVSSGSYITYEIDQTSVMPATGTKENVTVYLYWAAKLSTGNVFSTTNIDQDGNGNDRLDVNGFTKGNYAVVAGLKSNDTAGVNKNYIIAVDATTQLPATDGVNRKDFEVGDGTANVKNIKWEYSYTYNGTPSTESYDASASKIYYKLNNANNGGNAVEYTMGVSATSLPEYLEVYTAYTQSGFAAGTGYKDAKYSQSCAVAGVTKYTTVVALKIKDTDDNGDPYTIVFDKNDTTTAGYTWKDDKTCELAIDWVIEKGKLELSGVTWGYTVTGNTTPAEFRTEFKLDNGGQKIPVLDEDNNPVLDENNNPVFETLLATDAQGLKGIVPVITSLGVPKTVAKEGNYTGHGYGADTINQTKIDELLTTTVSVTLVDANFEQPAPIVLEWKVTKATLNITGWQEGGKVKVDGTDYTSPVVTSTDTSIADKVEYVYEYNGNIITLKELWEKADQDLAQGGTGRLSGVKVTVKAKNGYQFPAGATTTYTTTLGYTGTPITVTYDNASGEYGKADVKLTLTAAGIGDVTDEAGLYEVKVYAADGTELGVLGSDGATLSKLPVGTYKIAINTLIPGYTVKAGQDEITYEVKAIELDLPTLTKNPTFTGSDITVDKLLDETTLGYLNADLITVSGQGVEGSAFRDTGTTYTLIIKIKDTANYIWKAESAAATKFTLTAGEAKPETTRVDNAEADINWEILPYMVVVTDDMWNLTGKKGPKLNVSLPAAMQAEIGYNYYDARTGGNPMAELAAGNSAWVAAILTGADVDNGNILFADSGTNESAARVSYTMPKGGFANLASNAMNFLKENWLWLVIALAALIFLIILICIIRHRKKTKEERLAKKEAEKEKKEEEKRKKEEEKQRKEEERIRKEEEREAAKQKQQAELEAQKAKQQAELELAKAKQEAELAKIKAQAGMAGAGVAAMAMAQQPQQQQMPQQMPQQQQQPMQQPMMQQQQMPQQQMQMPQQMPYYPPMSQQQQSADSDTIRELKSEIASMRAEQRSDRELAAIKKEMELEFSKFRADSNNNNNNNNGGFNNGFMPMAMLSQMGGMQQQQTQPQQAQGGNNADMIGAVLASMVRNLAAGQSVIIQPAPKAEIPQKTEESKPLSVSYPPDAVVTTTTTVDTTKGSAPKRSREDELRALDIDGFYDTFEEGK